MIELQKVSWKIDEFSLSGVDCVVGDGDYAVLMGPTGCGKTTVLEIICGLRRPTAGRVVVAGQDVTTRLPGDRHIGYVPQDGALFPTMTVREQIAFGLMVVRNSREQYTRRVRPPLAVSQRHGLAALAPRAGHILFFF